MELVDCKWKFLCSGTLIEPNVVLVAAHNFLGKNISLLRIDAGVWDVSGHAEPNDLIKKRDFYKSDYGVGQIYLN